MNVEKPSREELVVPYVDYSGRDVCTIHESPRWDGKWIGSPAPADFCSYWKYAGGEEVNCVFTQPVDDYPAGAYDMGGDISEDA